jgi:hypothetical protein
VTIPHKLILYVGYITPPSLPLNPLPTPSFIKVIHLLFVVRVPKIYYLGPGSMAQVVEHLPSKLKALSSNPSIEYLLSVNIHYVMQYY